MKMYSAIEDLPTPPIEPVATLGNFDGVHRGHQAILARLKEEAARVGAPTMVVTFHPHPRQVLQTETTLRPIMSLKDRLRRLWELEVDHTLVIPFDADFAELTAQEFVEEILWDALRVTGMYLGRYVGFGHGREGDLRFLQSSARELGFSVGVVEPVVVEGSRVSSSRIRQAIAGAQLDLVARLMGRHHRVTGQVVTGQKRGRELGFPTANIAPGDVLLPPHGVYAGWAHLSDGSQHGAVVNIGVRPTFEGSGVLSVEAHLLDFEGDLYGQELSIALVRHLRVEVRFPSAVHLKRQMRADVVATRDVLGLA